jgi:catechol 2,3-dioxygenase-like lactoylglutathione lyase family enzyme
MTTARLQTHVSIDTADLAASVSFYRALLGAEPALERRDYARFDVSDPALVLGLNAVARLDPGSTGALEHLGVRFEDEADLGAARRRLERVAVSLQEEPDAECCYSRLERIWATDPSGVRWELFVVREAVVEAPSRAGSAASCCEPGCCATLDS